MKVKFFILLVLFFVVVGHVNAATFTPNNKVGIHLAVPSDEDIKRAGELVNSAGGKWGYVTLVIQENDRNKEKWQSVFDKLREHRLIPIIRIATSPVGPNWKKPRPEDARDWVNFLSSLNWVTKDRYVILFNETNHGQEWGGAVNPKEYAAVAVEFAKQLKAKDKNFFVMLAGLDASAPSAPPAYQDEAVYISEMLASEGDAFEYIDGWSSHSYPNPGFSGSPIDRGRGTVSSYEWELSYLQSLGVSKSLPVFITETGWPHSTFSPQRIGGFLTDVYQGLWLADERVRAVTPFVLNYQSEPFLQFSWQKKDSREMYEHFDLVQSMAKIQGDPEIIEKGKITSELPKELLVDSTYQLPITLENTGQAIWDKDEGYMLKIDDGVLPDAFFSDIKGIKPFSQDDAYIFIKTGSKKAKNTVNIGFYKGDVRLIDLGSWSFQTGPLPKLIFTAPLIPRVRADAKRIYEIQIFDHKEQLVFKRKGIKIKDGVGTIEQIRNVYPGGVYRVVLLTNYYLPRQSHLLVKKDMSKVNFSPLIPGDFNRDGRFGVGDILEVVRKPQLLLILIP